MLIKGSATQTRTDFLISKYAELLNSGVEAASILVLLQNSYKKDLFSAFSPSKKVAEKFATGENAKIEEIQVRPIDTWGSYQTTTEEEYLVPAKYLRGLKK